MRLYSGSSTAFVSDTVHNRVTDMLREAFRYAYRHDPGSSEVSSWRNSLRAVSGVIETAGFSDNGVILEYELPLSSKRLDCMVLGRDSSERDQAVIIELKQWEKCKDGYGDKVVTTNGGGMRDVLHPSVQVGQYQLYLEDAHTAFYEGPHPWACPHAPTCTTTIMILTTSSWQRSTDPHYEAYPLFMADHTRTDGYL